MLPQRFTHLRAFSAAAKPTSNFPTPKTKINLPGKVIQQFFKIFLREPLFIVFFKMLICSYLIPGWPVCTGIAKICSCCKLLDIILSLVLFFEFNFYEACLNNYVYILLHIT